jgi:hypothetical protein
VAGLLRDPEKGKLLKNLSIFFKKMKRFFLCPNPSSKLGVIENRITA